MFSLEEVFEAYYDCLRNKRSTQSALEFELNYDTNCIQLWRELNDKTYKPSTSIAFIVKRPRRREVFAANFRDRVLHHLIDLKIRPLLEVDFSPRTFNNRKGKGTSACVDQLKQDLKQGEWVLKMDLKGFFMSISKSKLTEMICKYIDCRFKGDKENLKWLISIIINDHPELNCELRSPWSQWSSLEKEKSLFFINPDKGIPIGNLISQLLANFYLTEFDKFVSDQFPLYGRYVDDFYIITNKREKALNFIPLIKEKLTEVGLTLHPNKFYCQHKSKGVEMLGVVLKGERSYVHNRTINNAFQSIKRLDKIIYPKANASKFISSLNAYLGFLKNHNTYAIKRNLFNSISDKWWEIIIAKKGFNVAICKDEFNARKQTIIKIKDFQKQNKKLRNGKAKRNQQKVRINPGTTELSCQYRLSCA